MRFLNRVNDDQLEKFFMQHGLTFANLTDREGNDIPPVDRDEEGSF